MDLYGVIGYPIKHSLSPVLHNWAFQRVGYKDKIYLAWEVRPENLMDFLNHLHLFQVKGLSVTIPHKQDLLLFAQKISPLAKDIGAANTLVWKESEWFADNTDLYGFITPLQNLNLSFQNALILGAGGASLAVIYGLKSLNLKKIYISNRTFATAQKLAKRFDLIPVEWERRHSLRPELLINTTPLGMKGNFEHNSPWENSFQGIKVVYDLIYNPKETLLLQAAKDSGCLTISGLDMFVHQAQKQFELFTGQIFPTQEALSALYQHLK
ncbi:MAG: shikimate dehydrogenase [Desulfonauticus sp.]|nr:shikimate dehydrogenase [Desulfonauticus sp.]